MARARARASSNPSHRPTRSGLELGLVGVVKLGLELVISQSE